MYTKFSSITCEHTFELPDAMREARRSFLVLKYINLGNREYMNFYSGKGTKAKYSLGK